MRHGDKVNNLGRTASHRKSLLSNMATSLILNKKINTTVAKAKALRTYVEPLINKSKEDTTHSRRTVFSYLQNKEAIKELFGAIAPRVATRLGGYTRILKTGFRYGDGAETCMIELVDFGYIAEEKTAQAKEESNTRRRVRRGSGKGKAAVVEA